MPLMKGKSEKAFKHNIRTEYGEGKPLKQSLAIAYNMKRKHKAKGGKVSNDHEAEAAHVISQAKKFKQSHEEYLNNNPGYSKQDKENIRKGIKKQYIADPAAYPTKKAHGGMAGYDDGGDVKPKPSPVPVQSQLPDNYGSVSIWDKAKAAYSGNDPYTGKPKGHSEGGHVCSQCGYAEGGQITDNYQSASKPHVDREFGHEHAEFESGFMKHPGNDVKHNSMAMSEDHKGFNQHPVDMHEETEHADDSLVDRIMHKHSMDYSGLDRLSHGGQVANQEHGEDNNELAGFSPNEFDDLVLRDELESTYGDDDNAGDSLDNEQENKDREDIIARIMKSRAKKDKLPRPA